METILEQQRRYHEERERLMDVMVKEMLTKKSTVRPGKGGGYGGVVWGMGRAQALADAVSFPAAPRSDQLRPPDAGHAGRESGGVGRCGPGIRTERPGRLPSCGAGPG